MNNYVDNKVLHFVIDNNPKAPVIKREGQSFVAKFNCGCEHRIHFDSDCIMLCEKHYESLNENDSALFEKESNRGTIHRLRIS